MVFPGTVALLLGHGLWVRAFAVDLGVLGRTIDLAGAEHDRLTVIGVMSEGYRPVFADTELCVSVDHDPMAVLRGE
jgi:hypothetical protein